MRIGGHDMRTAPRGQAQFRVFADEPRLFDYLTVGQHLEFMARLYQVADAPARSRVLR